MFRLTKFQLTLTFIFLMMLRIVVGYHFYKEGTNKLNSGTFTSKYFLADAKGPLAPMFKSMLEDPDGSQKLCISQIKSDNGTRFETDSSLTVLLWSDFLDQAVDYYGFGSEDLQQELSEQRAKLAQQIQDARDQGDTNVDTAALEAERANLEQQILAIRSQLKDGESILANHIERLDDWLNYNEVELISHFATADRLEGFERDGEHKQDAALFVDSLRYQVDTIKSDRNKKLAGWTSEVTAMWDSYESMINGLAVPQQVEGAALSVHRPFDQANSFYKIVDQVIPWFDTIIGVSLILGLLTRITSLAAAGFLVSVIMTQPPWLPGTQPTYFYFIELMALLVIFATCAGRYGGLDYFLNPDLYKNSSASASANTAASAAATTQPEGQPA